MQLLHTHRYRVLQTFPLVTEFQDQEMYSSDIYFKLFQVLKSNQKQIMNMLSSSFVLLLLLLSRMSWIVLHWREKDISCKNTDKADNLNTFHMYKAHTLGLEKQHTFLPHDFMRICTMIHGSAAVWVNPSVPPVPHGRIAAGSHTEEWSNCCDSPTSSSQPAAVVCSPVYTRVQTHTHMHAPLFLFGEISLPRWW